MPEYQEYHDINAPITRSMHTDMFEQATQRLMSSVAWRVPEQPFNRLVVARNPLGPMIRQWFFCFDQDPSAHPCLRGPIMPSRSDPVSEIMLSALGRRPGTGN